MPIGKRTSLENMFLLGEFSVNVKGADISIIAKPKTVVFGNLVNQGFPFYGTDITYIVPFE